MSGRSWTSVAQVQSGTALVDEAGATMAEVVDSIQRVTEVVSEISIASREQRMGVGQVGEAVTQMDQATQQNASLVQQSAAAADALHTQADHLVAAVAVFRVEARAHGSPAARAPAPAPARVLQRPLVGAVARLGA
ncbi:methyl-accepting chemotaxis protein [Paracidovorax cattleyae]|uniref:Methyl-accepting chemotaxis protein (MCP) signalling domain-containing protein n=1 Tax=Paracidovorax cattleyae TaxID=80868 RepID=A0A1H0QY94_9BURK|nr:Methyl-accepting chemotaxis protein (MCP) signalling domain-containing protein [Paracidovorax cattleyae]